MNTRRFFVSWIFVFVSFCDVYSQEPAPALPASPPASDSPVVEPTVVEKQPTEVPTFEKDLANAESTDVVDPDKKMVRLAFRDQEWLPALRWLANELKLNLDWQQLPTDTFSLHSSQEYSVREAEDLINMQLLARGFTLLKRGEVLRVSPLKDIDVTLVPHVSVEELDTLTQHQFVRISFPLDWMIAEQAAVEFGPLLSPYGKLFPMVSTNRLEAMDAVVNLRELKRLLSSAESDDARRERVAEFKLQYRRADEIASKVRQLVGLPADATSSSSAMTQLDIEQARFKVEAVKQMGVNAKEVISDKKPDVFLVINDKENSILVNAPPNKMEVIRQAIEAMDKPLTPGDSTWETVSRVKVHQVNGFDPESISKLLSALQERGNLAKETRIQHEAAYNRIIAFASPEDHLTISQVIESFRAQKRSATVLPLIVLDPVYAAKAVQTILKAPDRPSTKPGVASDGRFQIEPDIEHRRLLIWATDDELLEVREFLGRLGESFSQSVAASQMHILNLNGGSIDDVSKRFLNAWEKISDTPVIIEGNEANSTQQSNGNQSKAPEQPGKKNLGEKNISQSASPSNIRLISSFEPQVIDSDKDTSTNGKAADQEVAPKENPVRIVEGENGDVIILARDPVVAETAKRLFQQFIPDPKDMRVLQLKHAQAILVKRQLETMLAQNTVSLPSKLAATPNILIDVDTRTNRLIIQNATARQMRIIDEFVPTLDQPAPDDERLARKQRVYRFQYRRAADVLLVIKDVYRDLLSVTDRAFASSSNTASRPTGYNRNLAASAVNPEYSGILSIGVDEEANLLVLSGPSYLLEEISELAKSIDTPSDARAMSVVPFNNFPTDPKTKEALSKLFGEKKK